MSLPRIPETVVTVTFIAVDYPMAMFGYKKRATATQSPFVQDQNDIDQLSAWKELDGLSLPPRPMPKHEARKKALSSGEQADFVDRQGAKEFRAIASMALANPTWRVACCASLEAVLKYATYLHTTNHLQISRLIVLGHGNVGIMAIGSGKADMAAINGKQAPIAKGKFLPDPAKNKAPPVREITESNSDRWAPMFRNAAACFVADDFELVFVYLLGCSTAAPYEKHKEGDPGFIDAVAEALAQATNLPTVVVGACKHLQEDHLMGFFNELDDTHDKIAMVLSGDTGATSHEVFVAGMRYRAVLAKPG
jgi:hypothetical protein